jgi:glucose-6-phosphate 1-dehydrogenase
VSAAAAADALVFFGATGDLAYKQIFPALQSLVRRGTLNVPIIGIARSGWNLDQLRARARDSLEHHGGVDRGAFDRLSSLLQYVDGDYGDSATYDRLRRELRGAARPLHYLAIPPSAFAAVVDGLGRSGCAARARVAVEKPFGRDVASARALNKTLHQVFPESSIFRIDHYLGKAAVLNLFYFRFANVLPEAALNRDRVACVQITMAERFGVRGRGAFYEETGAIRDVLQNHLLQILAVVAMDPPVGRDVEAIRDEKVRLLKAIAPLQPEQVVRGQFRGYRDEPGVARDSCVETFAAVQLAVESWRWAGVPFFVRAGKCMPVDAVEVRIDLKPTPRDLFRQTARTCEYFRFRLGPGTAEAAIGLHVKRRGESTEVGQIELLATSDQAGDVLPYERLLGDAVHGDASLFGREDAIEEQWRIVEPALSAKDPPLPYEPGSWGPSEAERLVAGVTGGWHKPINPERSP